MIYLSQILGLPVCDAKGEEIGTVNDLGIATGEVFPRVTSLAFQGPGKTPFMISWRKYVERFDGERVTLQVNASDIRFSYLQPDEVLIARDLMNKQIVDTRGMKVVRVNDLKLSDSGSSQLRLLGAEVGARGILRAIWPGLETICCKIAAMVGKEIPERLIAWNYMDLLDRDMSNVQLSVTHKTLDELHPADIADIIEQLDPRLRGQVFNQLDDAQAAEAIAELDDDQAAEIMADMEDSAAAGVLTEMDPDDAAELVSELSYDKAEKLLRLMGVQEQRAVRQLLGYREDTAGRIMTSEFLVLGCDDTVQDAIDAIRGLEDDFETAHYIYICDEKRRLRGVLSLRLLVVNKPGDKLMDLAETDIITASPDDDQEDVAEAISKYNLLAMPVTDENNRLLGIVTVDDALDVLEEEHREDLHIAGSTGQDTSSTSSFDLRWFLRREMWYLFWLIGCILFNVISPASFGELGPLLAILPLPIALYVADDMVIYVTNTFLEYDEEDEEAPSILGFSAKAGVLGIFIAAWVWFLGRPISQMLTASIQASEIVYVGFAATAISIIVSFLSAPLYLKLIRLRDRKSKETSGIALSILALSLALIAFIAATFIVAGLKLG